MNRRRPQSPSARRGLDGFRRRVSIVSDRPRCTRRDDRDATATPRASPIRDPRPIVRCARAAAAVESNESIAAE